MRLTDRQTDRQMGGQINEHDP